MTIAFGSDEGLFVADGDTVSVVDELPSEALFVGEQHVYRIVRPNGERAERILLTYDRMGVLRGCRLDLEEPVLGIVAEPDGLLLFTAAGAWRLTPGRWWSAPHLSPLPSAMLSVHPTFEGPPEGASDALKGMSVRVACSAALPPWALQSLAVAYATNPTRVREEAQMEMFRMLGVTPYRLWALGDALPAESLCVRVSGTLPKVAFAGKTFTVRFSVRNEGDAILVSAPPNPVVLSYRWYDETRSSVILEAAAFVRLPYPLRPWDTAECTLAVEPPASAGSYHLVISVVQRGIGWACDVDAAHGLRTDVALHAGEEAALSP